MKQSLSLKSTQHLALTPQLKQSLHLLQLSTADLQLEIQSHLDTNPLLEKIEEADQTSMQDEDKIARTNEYSEDSAMDDWENNDPRADDVDKKDDTSDWQTTPSRSSANHYSSNEGFDWQQTHERPETLTHHLLWQLQMAPLSERDQDIAATIIHSLDDDGYLTSDIDSLRQLMNPRLEIENDEIQAVLSLIKTLDPVGAGAQSLGERLCLLLDNQECDDAIRQLAKQIINHHLPLLAARNYQGIRKALSPTMEISLQQVTDAARLISTLNPRISSQFGEYVQNQITADVIVQKVRGKWVAKLNPDQEIKLGTNKEYTDILRSSDDEKSAQFLHDHLNQAKAFIKNIKSRYATLLAVAQAVVDAQQAFFEEGTAAMNSMVLQDIADQLELHESTVSRATAGKYLLCQRGLFELKYFFSSAVARQDGNTSSSTAIRSIIKQLIDTESKAKPLSDSRLAKELENQGHVVARRTVAKYRESLRIAPSSQRKRLGDV